MTKRLPLPAKRETKRLLRVTPNPVYPLYLNMPLAELAAWLELKSREAQHLADEAMKGRKP